MTSLRVLPEAEEELAEAAEWYEERRPGLGVALIARVDRAFDEILEAPNACMLWRARTSRDGKHGDTRRGFGSGAGGARERDRAHRRGAGDESDLALSSARIAARSLAGRALEERSPRQIAHDAAPVASCGCSWSVGRLGPCRSRRPASRGFSPRGSSSAIRFPQITWPGRRVAPSESRRLCVGTPSSGTVLARGSGRSSATPPPFSCLVRRIYG